MPAAEAIKDELQRRLGLDASLGLASSRLAARVASTWARPRGLLVVLPGYEASFLARQPVSFLEDLPPHLEHALDEAGIPTLGELSPRPTRRRSPRSSARTRRERLRAAARRTDEEPIAVAAPPAWIQEEALIRDRRTDRAGLLDVVEGSRSAPAAACARSAGRGHGHGRGPARPRAPSAATITSTRASRTRTPRGRSRARWPSRSPTPRPASARCRCASAVSRAAASPRRSLFPALAARVRSSAAAPPYNPRS